MGYVRVCFSFSFLGNVFNLGRAVVCNVAALFKLSFGQMCVNLWFTFRPTRKRCATVILLQYAFIIFFYCNVL